MVFNKIKDFIRTKFPPLFAIARIIWATGGTVGRWEQVFICNRFPESYYKKKVLNDIKTLKNRIRDFDSNEVSEIPGNVVVEINNTCNLNCLMCATQQAKREKGEMSIDLFERTIEQIITKLGRRGLTVHTVGEPLFYSDLPAIFRICKKYNLKLHFTTNGLLLHKYIDLINEFPGMISSIAFSIDGATKETFEKIRRGGNFERLVSNLELIHNYNRNAKKNERIPISLQAVISDDNFKEIPLFFKVFKKYFPQEKMLFGFVSNLSASHEQCDYYKSKKLNTDRLERRNTPCKLLWLQTHILWNGDVSACCRDYNGELIVGNIFEKSVLDIWKGDVYENYRDAHRKREVETMPLCKDCWHMAPEARPLLNHYIHYLFKKFKDRTDEFYLGNIRNVLEYLNNNYTDDFIKSYKDLSFFRPKMSEYK